MISIFYPPYGFGGDAVYLHRLVDALARRDCEVDVIHCVDAFHVLSRNPQIPELSHHPNVTVHSLRSGWGLLSPLLAQQTGRPVLQGKRIQEILQGKKFDVIHFHNISLFGPQVLALRPDYADFIKVYTTHEHWLVCPMHVLWKYNRRLCDHPTCFACTLAFKRPPQLWRYSGLLERALDHVDLFIAPSRFTAEMHRQRGFGKPFEHLPHFVPEPPDDSFPGVPVHPRPYFLFVGRLEKIKGVQELIPAFRNYPHADLLIAGTGTQEGELRRLASGMQNVVFLGRTPLQQLPALYRNALALVVPSIGYEVFGIIMLEAFTQKTPVIANALGSLPEVVEESGGGLLYRNQIELLDAMERLRTNPELRRRLGERAYQAYRERWCEEKHVETYFRLLEEVAARKLGHIPWHSATRASSGPAMLANARGKLSQGP